MIEELLSHQLSEAQENFLRKSTQGITFVALLFIGPFTIYHFIQGDFFIAFSATFMLSVISFSAWNTLAGRLSYKLSFTLLTPAFLIFSWVAIKELGVMGVLWSYPALIMFYFIFPERLARVANIMLFAVVLPRTFLEIDTDIALRVAATLVGVSILCSIIVRHLNAQQLEWEEMVSKDPLTMLPNRLSFEDSIERAVAYSEARRYPLSMLSLDLDNFRRINEQYGYKVGDEVLQIFSGLLVKKTVDTDEVFRLGGEEFIIVLNGSDSGAVDRVAAEIHEGLKQTHLSSGERVIVTVSMGAATLKKGESCYDLLSRCDENLHQAKAAGGNCTQA